MNINCKDLSDIYKNITAGTYEKAKLTGVPKTSGTQQDDAAVMEISSQGYEKSIHMQLGELMESNPDGRTKEPEHTEDAISEESFEELIRFMKSGGTLSEEEEQQVNKRMLEMTIDRYHKMLDWYPKTDEEIDKMFKQMKNNFLMKQRTLLEMQEKIEVEKLEAAAKDQEAKNAKNAKEHADNLGEARMLERTLENLNDGEINSSESSKARKLENTDSEETEEEKEIEIAGSVSGKDLDIQMHSLHKAIRFEQRDEDNLKALRDQWKEEGEDIKKFSKLLDEDFARTMIVMEHDDFSAMERVNAYENFLETSKEFAEGREYAKEKKQFDFYTIREVRLAEENKNIQQAQKQISEQLQDSNEAVLKETGRNFITKDAEERIQDIEEQRKYDKEHDKEYDKIKQEKSQQENLEFLKKEDTVKNDIVERWLQSSLG